jgi:NmrA-like family
MVYQNIALLGALGRFGRHIIETILRRRNEFGNICILTSEEGMEGQMEIGISNIFVDYNDLGSIVRALQGIYYQLTSITTLILVGVDTVVSLFSKIDTLEFIKIVDGAIAAGVTRFIPSEFSFDMRSPGHDIAFFQPMLESFRYLEAQASIGNIEFTTIATGSQRTVLFHSIFNSIYRGVGRIDIGQQTLWILC